MCCFFCCFFCCFQVDNPCAVLDQENSKKFLQGSDEDKYAFFMKATDLDRILAVSAFIWCGVKG